MRHYRKNYLLISFVLLLALFVTACGGDQSTEEPAQTESETNSEEIGEDSAEVVDAEDNEPAETSEPETSDDPEETTEENIPTPESADSDETSDFDIFGEATEEDYITTDSGLRYYISEESGGDAPADGDIVSVHYAGFLDDGTPFDSSYDRGFPFQFPLGQSAVIKGWDEGIALMKVGEKARLIIPAELGYGETGSQGVIPPGATLIFDVELVDVQEGSPDDPAQVNEDDYTISDSGLKYYDLVEGEGPLPSEGQTVVFHFTAWLEDGTKIDSSIDRGQPVGFVIGDSEVLLGWNEGIESMKAGGMRQLVLPPELAFGEEGAGNGIIPPNATMIFEINLLSIE